MTDTYFALNESYEITTDDYVHTSYTLANFFGSDTVSYCITGVPSN